jgi:hypothetical protein
MSYSSKLCALALLLTLVLLSGCIQDAPHDTDMPWSGPAAWEGTMPLPGSIRNQYE